MTGQKNYDEMVKHLRLIHFVLIITTIGLIAASWSNRDVALEKASNDIQKILNIQNEWHRDPQWLDRIAEERVRSHFQDYSTLSNSLASIDQNSSQYCEEHNFLGSFPLTIECDKKRFQCWACVHGRNWTLRGPVKIPMENRPDQAWGKSADRLELETPQRLDEFIKIWDWLYSSDYVYILGSPIGPIKTEQSFSIGEQNVESLNILNADSPEIVSFHKISSGITFKLGVQRNDKKNPITISKVHKVLQFFPIPLESNEDEIQYDRDLTLSAHILEGELPVTVKRGTIEREVGVPLHIKISSHPVHFNPLSKMIDLTKSDIRIGEFHESFPELYKITKQFQSTRLDHIEVIVSEMYRESKGKIEIVGILFPTTLVSSIGSLAIVILQLYFCLHFHEFTLQVSGKQIEFEIPWIGLYQDRLSRWVNIISIMFLPPLGILTLQITYLIESWRFQFSSCVVVGSAIISFIISLELVRRIAIDFVILHHIKPD